MTQTAPATPCLAKVPLDADRQAYALLIVHADRAIAPQPALREVVEFESTPHGGFISAAQAHDGGWGYINEQGQWLVPPTLDRVRLHRRRRGPLLPGWPLWLSQPAGAGSDRAAG